MFDLWYHNDSLLSKNKLIGESIGEFEKTNETVHFERKKAIPHGPSCQFHLLGRLMQGDHHEFKASLSYSMSWKPECAIKTLSQETTTRGLRNDCR